MRMRTKRPKPLDRTVLFVSEGGNNSDGIFTTPFSFSSVHEVLMVLKDTTLFEHSSFHGGNVRQFHRGANGHTRFVTCKEDSCDKTVIKAKRKTPHELWSYLVQIALCTKWGQAARFRALFNNVCKVRGEADEERRGLRLPLSDDGRLVSLPGLPRSSASTTSRKTPSEAQVPGWDVVSEAPSSASGYGAPVCDQEPVCWIYGMTCLRFQRWITQTLMCCSLCLQMHICWALELPLKDCSMTKLRPQLSLHGTVPKFWTMFWMAEMLSIQRSTVLHFTCLAR